MGGGPKPDERVGGASLRSRRRARADVGQQVRGVSQPTLKRMNPSATSFPAPAGAALGGGVHAAEARGVGDQLAAREERLGPSLLPRSKATIEPKRVIWRRASAWEGSLGRPG